MVGLFFIIHIGTTVVAGHSHSGVCLRVYSALTRKLTENPNTSSIEIIKKASVYIYTHLISLNLFILARL